MNDRDPLSDVTRYSLWLYARIVLVLLATAFLGAFVAIRVTHPCGPMWPMWPM